MDNQRITSGSVRDDGCEHRGWIVGHFMPDGPERTTAVEVKWGEIAAGETRHAWTSGDTRTALWIVVSGRAVLMYRDHDGRGGGSVQLGPGDYVIWSNLDHSWTAIDDTVGITVRWPSTP